MSVINPLTDRRIKIGGKIHKNLVKNYIICDCIRGGVHKVKLSNKYIWDFFIKPSYRINTDILEITNVGVYSISKPYVAKQITKIISNFIKSNHDSKSMVITDATANVGGNTISFLLAKFKVNCIEMDKCTCSVLKKNLSVYNFNEDLYTVICKDYTKIYKQLIQDIVFIDPPWGGTDYKSKKNLNLFLSKINVINICFNLLKNDLTKLIVMKLPINFNYDLLYKKLKASTIKKYDIYNKYKSISFNLVLISRL